MTIATFCDSLIIELFLTIIPKYYIIYELFNETLTEQYIKYVHMCELWHQFMEFEKCTRLSDINFKCDSLIV